MARVFISHAGEDLEWAARLRDWLVEDGHEVFLDRDLRDGIAVGEEWEQRLHERLRWADAMVCVITTAYVRSTWCTAEVGIARSRGLRQLPLRAEPGAVHPLLRSVQYADLTRDPDAARAALTEAFRRVDQRWSDDRSPFPGLRPFEAELHRVFFGRDTDIARLAGLLRSPAEQAGNAALLVVGPSGCGKSSLLRAGLLPTMAAEPDWLTLSAFTPGGDPLSALVRELAAAAKALGLATDDIRSRVLGGDVVGVVDDLLLAAPGTRRKRLLVAIDQFEVLLTQPAADLPRFVAVLRALLTAPVSIVATVRPEFLDRALVHAELATLPMVTHMLRPLRRETLRTVIEGPARLAGITVSDELVGRLVEDTDSGDALPLLAFTLEQLAEGVGRGGELSMTRYDALGGVRGALVRQADAALTDAMAATGRGRDEVLTTLLRIVTIDEQNRPTRWRVRRGDLSETESAELDAFVARRLLTVDTVGEDAVIGASHEAFFTAWPPLDATIRDTATALRARRQVEDAAAEWDANARPAESLWERGQLAAATNAMDVDVRARKVRVGKVHVSPRARDFLYASVRRDRFRRRRLVLTLSVLLVLAMAAATVAFVQRQVAQEQQRVAQEQALISTSRLLTDKAEAVIDTDPPTAVKLAVAAHRIHPDPDTYATLQEVVMTTPYAAELHGVASEVRSIAFAPDGRRLAVGYLSGAILLWDLEDPLRPRVLGKPFINFDNPVTLAFSGDGTRLATAGLNGEAAVWDVTDPEHPRTTGTPLVGDEDVPGNTWLSPDGTMLATAVDDKPGLQLWDLTDPAEVRPLGKPLSVGAKGVNGVGFSPDSTRIAVSSAHDVPVALWDITQRAAPRLLSTITPNPTDLVDTLSFSADGSQLALGGFRRGTALWDITDPTRPRQARDQLRVALGARVFFSPRATTLATTSNSVENGVLLWDVTDPDYPRQSEQLRAGRSDREVAFSPDGNLVATGGDGVVTLWDLRRHGQPTVLGPPFVGHGAGEEGYLEIYSLALSEDAHMVATAGRDGTIELWDIADPTKPRLLGTPITAHESELEGIDEVAFSPSGDLLVSGGADERATLWDIRDPGRPRRLTELSGFDGIIRTAVFSPDGRTLTVGTDTKTVAWDIRDPQRPRRRATVFEDEGVLGIWRVRDGRVLALVKGSGQYAPSSAIAAPTTTTRSESGEGGSSGGDSGARPAGGPGDPNGSRLWDITDPAHPRRLGPGLTGHDAAVESAALSPDGTLLGVSDEDGTAIFWDLRDPERPRRIGDPLAPHSRNSSIEIAYPPQGGIMATGGLEGMVYLWDIGNPVRPYRLGPGMDDNVDAVYHLTFSTDGKLLVSAGSDGDVVLWDMTPFHALRRDPAATACQIVDRGLDRDEWTRNVPGMPYRETCVT